MRIEALSADELLKTVRSQRLADPDIAIVAVVPTGLNEDEVLALCAVLGIEGVADIEGAPPVVVKRCIDTARIIATGDLGVICT